MLTLKAPIELKHRSNFIHDSEAFYNRITANYSLMGTELAGEDLLHAVTSPPEIFIQEGDITTVAGGTVVNSRNEEKLEIFNNLLNRILVSVNAPLTYQDRVYISDVLLRLGIKNDQLFMNEVRELKRESINTNNLINLYLTGGEAARAEAMHQYINNFLDNIDASTGLEINEVRESRLALNIMNRLKTGAIYQILSNFNTNLSDTYINRNEYAMSEQSYTAKHLLVERLMERLTGEPGELVYRSENIYEEEFVSEEQESTEVTQNISAAVLLDMVRNLYHTGYDRINYNTLQWYEFRDILYNSSENTLARINHITSDTYYTSVTEMPAVEARIELPAGAEEEEQETTVKEADEIELLRKQVEEVNERNIRNIEKYRQLRTILDQAHTIRRREGGENLTRKASRELLTMGEGSLETILEGEERQLPQSSEVIREITKLFPENRGRVYEFIEQYLAGDVNAINSFNTVVRNDLTSLVSDIESVRVENEKSELILRETASTAGEAAEEIKRLSGRREAAPEAQRGRTEEITPPPIVHRSEETISLEDIEETLQNYRQDTRKNVVENAQTVINEERRSDVYRTVDETNSYMTQRQREDIAELVNQGVKRQMNAISNEVMHKLENRLRNEKSRRGI